MARITPSAFKTPELEAHEAYPAWVKSFDTVEGAAQYGSKPRLQVDLALDKEGADTIRDFCGITIGSMPNGQPTKLREFLNALAGKPANTPIEWFDDETFEWGYPGEAQPFASLESLSEYGHFITFRGTFAKREDGSDRYVVEHYQPYKKNGGAPAGVRSAPKPQQPPESTRERAQRVRQEASESEDAPF